MARRRGTRGDDHLIGGTGRDYIDGRDGNDLIDGGDGDDRLKGGRGADELRGGAGDDRLDGGDGDDLLKGGSGDDCLDGGSDNDELRGGSGNDWMYGGSGDDVLKGGSGNDILLGGSGVDLLRGGSGNDFLSGGSGDDDLGGGSGDDILLGGSGNDQLNGGTGNDVLDGGSGDDRLNGGAGNDILLGGSGDDRLNGGDGDDILKGGWGDDRLRGGEGDDVLLGDGTGWSWGYGWGCHFASDDNLDGGAGSDYVYGGRGDDKGIWALSENIGAQDVYDGGRGWDTLVLKLTAGELADAEVQAELAALDAFIAANANPWRDWGPVFEFNGLGATLHVQDWEDYRIRVINSGPDAVDDVAGIDEDSVFTVSDPALGLLGNDSDLDALDVIVVTGFDTASTLGATVVVNPDGTYSYDATGLFDHLAVGESLTDSFNYTISDLAGESDTATVTITVTGENDAPVVEDVSLAAEEDGATVVAAFSGSDVDSDDDGSTLTYTVSATPAEGTVINNGDGTFAFDPGSDFQDLAAGETREVKFEYTATDSHGAVSNTGTVTVTVTGTNDDPVIAIGGDVSGEVQEDATLSVSGDLDFSDVDNGATASWSVAGGGAGIFGALAVDGNGIWTYTLDNAAPQVQALAVGESHDEVFTVVVTDDQGATDTQTVTVTVTGTNDGPMAQDDAFTIAEDTGLSGNVFFDNGNGPDFDVDGDPLSVVPLAPQGPLDGSFDALSGTWTLTYQGATAAQTITLDPSNLIDLATWTDLSATFPDSPSFIPGTVIDASAGTDVTVEGTSAAETILGGTGQSDIRGDGGDDLIFGGEASSDPSPLLDFDDFLFAGDGDDILVGGAGYDVFYVNRDGGDNVILDGNTAVGGFSNGLVLFEGFDAAGDIDFFDADGNDQGVDESDVQFVNNGDGTWTINFITSTGSVTFASGEISDINLQNNEPGGFGGTTVIYTFDDGGTAGDYSDDSYVSVSAGVETGDGAGVVHTANGGTAALNRDGSFDYTPASNFVGVDSFTYTMTDIHGVTDTATVSITVENVNDAPIVSGVAIAAVEDGPAVTGAFTGDDIDADDDGATLTYAITSAPSEGSVANNGDGTFAFDPGTDFQDLALGETRDVSFTYEATDSHGAVSNSGTVTVTVTGTNDAPVAPDDDVSGNEDTVISGDVLANDSDKDGDTLTVTLGTNVANGVLVLNADGTFDYTPDADFFGTDSFTYTVSDGKGGFDSATVDIEVTPIDDPGGAGVAQREFETSGGSATITGITIDNPDTAFDGVLVEVTITAREGGALTLADTAGLDSVSGDGSEVIVITGTNAEVNAALDGMVYTPDAGGSFPAAVDVSFVEAGSDDAPTVNRVYVSQPAGPATGNSAPVANFDFGVADADTGTIIDVLGNDTDPDGDGLVVTDIRGAENGSLDISLDGTSVFYRPDAGFAGIETFSYTVSDGQGGSATGLSAVVVGASVVGGSEIAESLTGGDGVEVIESFAGADTIDAAGGDDVVIGGAGNDVIDAGAGDDAVVWQIGDGDDMVEGGAGFDIAAFDLSGGDLDAVTVTADNGAIVVAGTGTDAFTVRLTGVEDVAIRGATNLTVGDLTGTDIADDTVFLMGTDESDTLDGSALETRVDGNGFRGSDTILGGSGDDSLTAGNEKNTQSGEADFIHGGAGNDKIQSASVGSVLDGGTGDDDIKGLDGNAVLFGGLGDDSLVGTMLFDAGKEDDGKGKGSTDLTLLEGLGLLDAGPGADVVEGGENPDEIFGGPGADILRGNKGDDIIFDDDRTWRDSDGVHELPESDESADVAEGGEGNDIIELRGGDNILRGGQGEDYLVAGSGADLLEGGSEGDTLKGGDGDDIIIGGTGNDVMSGGGGADVFRFGLDSGHDRITDFELGIDRIETVNGQAIDSVQELGGDTLVTFVDGSTVTLTGVTGVASAAELAGGSPAVAGQDSLNVTEDTPLIFTVDSLLANDVDPDGTGTITLIGFEQPAHGTLVELGGVFTYTPNANYFGSDSFRYTITDGEHGETVGTVRIDVTGTPDAAIPQDDFEVLDAPVTTFHVNELLRNDIDVDGGGVGFDGFGAPGQLTTTTALGAVLTFDPASQTITYDGSMSPAVLEAVDFYSTRGLANGFDKSNPAPWPHFVEDSFSYSASDGQGGFASANVTLIVYGQNDAPEVENIAFTLSEDDAPVSVAFVGDDPDANDDATSITYELATQPSEGTVVNNGDGTFSFDPGADFQNLGAGETRDVTFTYTATDTDWSGNQTGALTSDPATVTVTVTGLNDAPVAFDDVLTGESPALLDFIYASGNSKKKSGLGLDLDVSENNGSGGFGVLDQNVEGLGSRGIKVLEAADFDGDGDVDVMVGDDQGLVIMTNDGGTMTGPGVRIDDVGVYGADIADIDGDGDLDIMVAHYDSGDIAILTNDGDGNFTRTTTPGPSYGSGMALGDIDGDGDVDAFVPNWEDENAWLVINQGGAQGGTEGTFIGGDAGFATSIGGQITATALADIDGDGDLDALAGNYDGVGVYINDGTGNFSAGDTLSAGPSFTSNIEVADIDGDGDFDIVRVGYSGGDELQIWVNQGGNQAGIEGDFALGDTFSVDEGALDVGDVDGDGDIDIAYLVADGSSQDGAMLINQGGDQGGTEGEFVPEPVTAEFTIQRSGMVLLADIAERLPTGFANEDRPVTIATSDLLANDTDIDGDPLSVVGLAGGGVLSGVTALGASVVLDTATGEITYDASALASIQELSYGDVVNDSFTYTVSDGNGLTDTATVSLTVGGVNDAPVVVAPLAFSFTDNDAGFAIDLLTGASDVDAADNLSVANLRLVSGPTLAGNLSGNTYNVATGGFYLDPLIEGESETIVISYDIIDGNGGAAAQTLTFNVAGANDAPVMFFAAGEDSGLVVEDDAVTSVSGQAGAFDFDARTSLTWTVDGGGAGTYGDLTVDANGLWTYTLDNSTPALDFLNDGQTALETFSLQVTDEFGATDTENVVITIEGNSDFANMAPVAMPETLVLQQNVSITFDPTANDTDADGDPISPIASTNPANGNLSFNSSEGTYTYTPNFNYFGADSFTYTVSDGQGGFDTATVDIKVERFDFLSGTAGDDIFAGGAGNDNFTGNGGDDLFIFDRGSESETINDFEAGAGTGDRIDVSDWNFTDFNDLLSSTSQQDFSFGSIIDFQSGLDRILLIGVQTSELHEDDFLF